MADSKIISVGLEPFVCEKCGGKFPSLLLVNGARVCGKCIGMEIFRKLTPEQRAAVTSGYCKFCWNPLPPAGCHCENDE